MAGIWVQLKMKKKLEVQGESKMFSAGDWVQVGKQKALAWYISGEAVPRDPSLLDRILESRKRKDKAYSTPFSPGVRDIAKYVRPLPRVTQTVTDQTFTIFAVPLPFHDAVQVKQDNAISSWQRLEPTPIIFLFGGESGTVEACARLGCVPLPNLAHNEFGTPLVGDVFKQAAFLCDPGDVICYVNSDIILLQDFADTLVKVAATFDQFLMIGERWDVDLSPPLDFKNGWDKRLRKYVAQNGRLHGSGAIDYFAHRPGLYRDIPPFAIGRSAWDNWLVGHAIRKGAAVVDATETATAIHQDKGSTAHVMTDERMKEKQRNRALYDADRDALTGTINEAPWVVTAGGEIVERSELDSHSAQRRAGQLLP